jgi:hypothetical protein
MKLIEEITAEAILQDAQTITVAGREYRVSPPTVATLIEASKYIARVPDLPVTKSEKDIYAAFAVAKDCECYGDIVAILMLGKKHLRSEERVVKRRFLGLLKEEHVYVRDNQKILAETLLSDLSSLELWNLTVELIKMQNVSFFLSISAVLREVNMIQRTKTTAPGPSSPES